MDHELTAKLAPIGQRLQQQAARRALVRGSLAGAAAAVAVGSLRWAAMGLWGPAAASGWAMAGWGVAAGAAVLAGALLGRWRGLPAPVGWTSLASMVDAHYQLDDRTLTALQLLEKPARRPLEEYQVAEAMERLSVLRPEDVVPAASPPGLAWVLLLLALAAGLVGWPVASGPWRSLSDETLAASRVASRPAAPRPSVAPPAPAGSCDWQPAAPAIVSLGRTDLFVGVTLEAMLAGSTPEGREKEQRSPAAGEVKIVQDDEPASIADGQIVRRYFESIRAQAAK